MTTRIEREFSFQAGVYFKEEFLMNLYTITVYMEVETESIREQNVAMERIKHFLNECLENGIFVVIWLLESIKFSKSAIIM